MASTRAFSPSERRGALNPAADERIRVEVPATLEEPAPRPLGLIDQLGLWGNLGVSLLGFTGALFVLQPGGPGTPRLSLVAALSAIVLGTLLGTAAVAASGVAGAQSGAPAMVLLRGLLGAKVSYVPTALNIVQLVGWGTFELVTISAAAHRLAPGVPRWGFVVLAGGATTLLTMRPLGWVRVLRRYVTVLVALVLVYLLVELATKPLAPVVGGSWSGFFAATDTTVAVAISFAPLAADYTRHSRSPSATFTGSLLGYSLAQIACYTAGLLALLGVARRSGDIYGAFLAVPLGSLAFSLLALREIDQSFADVYSTAVSVQNLRPRWDRRVLSGAVGVCSTALALWWNVADYQSFLLLIGSVFVPMLGVFVVDYFLVGATRWDLSTTSPSRFEMLVPWALGFVAYQLVNPGSLGAWTRGWTLFASAIGFRPAAWMSASICSFGVAALATALLAGGRRVLAATRP